ncbi:hypothetical protein M9Y10_019119 [Tritrichomonas musculus]|uniref:Right handed beta helix domain-containing protein n=1 Tax=Tritrichomonas musculus TaxID=1915356 RepID=A0ABR2GKC5_9EUKA
MFFVIELFIALSVSNEIKKQPSLLEDCTKPGEDYQEIIDGSGIEYDKVKLYSCQQQFTSQITIKNSVFTIKSCTFKDFKLEFEVYGIILINFDDNFPSELTGNVEILNTDFQYCDGGCVYFTSSSASKSIDIVQCTFDHCSVYSGATAISIQAAKGKIDNCKLIKNKVTGATAGYIFYDPPENQNDDEKLTISNCIFKHSEKSNTDSILLFNRDNLKIDIIGNQFKIDSKCRSTYLFGLKDWATIIFQGWTFTDNCMFPLRTEYVCYSFNDQIEQITDKLSECVYTQCPPEPDPNSHQYVRDCETLYDESTKVALDSLIGIFDCTFNQITNSDTGLGGGLYIKTSNNINKDIKLPIKIYNTDFSICSAVKGGAICIESTETGRLFEIKKCCFNDNWVQTDGYEDNNYGGAIYIDAKFSSVLIEDSLFGNDNMAGNGAAICYVTNSTSTTSSKALLEDEYMYSLRINYCHFNKNWGQGDGGAIFISLTNGEPSKPIEIIDCFFNENRADESDYNSTFDELFLPESGGSIYFYYKPSTTPSESFGFSVNNCQFIKNTCGSKGGAICIILKNNEPAKPIEINHCIFDGNKAHSEYQGQQPDGYGGSIYYSYTTASESSSKTLLATNPSLHIIDCTFSNGFANVTGGSVSIFVNNVQTTRPIEITKCIFEESTSTDGGAVDITSNKPVLFEISDCQFKGKCQLNFKAISGHVKQCNFTNMNELSAIRYDCDTVGTSSPDQLFKIESCNFVQDNEVTSLVFFVPKTSSNFEFISNTINISNNVTCIFDCSSDAQLAGTWKFESNIISPAKEKFIKTENAKLIQFGASCSNGFECETDLPGQTCDGSDRCVANGNEIGTISFVSIFDVEFNGFDHPTNGGAVELKNYGIVCNQSKFIQCKSQQGGGGIYIYIDIQIEDPILLVGVYFSRCEAIFGGAVYIYCNQESNTVQVLQCTFENNVASKVQTDDQLFGGSAIYLSVYNCDVIACKFSKNIGTGVKFDSSFDRSTNSIKLSKTGVSIENCVFEMNDKSSSSIFYVHSNRKQVEMNVKDCIFTGNLAKNAHHIDGTSIVNKIDAPKINIEFCKFSTDEKTALNLNRRLVRYDAKSQEFNFHNSIEKKANEGFNWKLISGITMSFIGVAVIMTIIVIRYKKSNEDENEEENDNEMNLA